MTLTDSAIERLKLGDILVASRVLIERKAVEDFSASVVDKRLFRQMAGLRAEPFEPLVILEGEFTAQSRGQLSAKAIRAAMLTVILDWRVTVLRSRSVEDTARWVAAILDRARDEKDLPDWRWITPSGGRVAPEKVRRRPSAGRPKIAEGPRQRAIRMLSQIEGVGEGKAASLIDRMGGLGNVLKASRENLIQVPGISRLLAERIFEVTRVDRE